MRRKPVFSPKGDNFTVSVKWSFEVQIKASRGADFSIELSLFIVKICIKLNGNVFSK